MNILARTLSAICFCIPPFLVHAQTPSCLDTMSDTRALDACAKSEIIPLEEKEKREFDRLVAKFKNDPDMLSILQLGKRGWDGYVHNHCFFEGVAISGKPSGIEAQRPFMKCVKRAYEIRVKELEAM